MTILELDDAAKRYAHLDLEVCDDPRHAAADDVAVAVIETAHDVYPVCEACLAAVMAARDN